MNKANGLAKLCFRITLILILTGAVEVAHAAVCTGSQYGIYYRIRCWNDGSNCVGSAVHPDGRITQALLTRDEAAAACSELMQ